MTRVILTWQKDESHSEDFDEEVILGLVDQGSLSSTSTGSYTEERLQVEDTLHPLDRQTIFAILTDTVEQLSIMKAYVNEPVRPGWLRLFEFKTIEERFSMVGSLKDEFVEEEYEKIPYRDTNKLQKELCLLITTLKEGAKEIFINGTFDTILKVLEALHIEVNELSRLQSSAAESEAQYLELKLSLASEKTRFGGELESLAETIAHLKDDLEDVLNYGKQEVRYTNDWENTRTYLHELTLNTEEDVYNDVINRNAIQTEYENRVANEVEAYILENTEDLKNDIQYWMQEYDFQIDKRDDDILKLKMRWDTLAEDHKALATLYEEHKVACEEWVAHKEELRLQAELLALQTKAAIRIQAWWRGTMVRKKLGPFRPKKGKGKGKDKGKKGKKK